jgi:DNA-binding CsgD family transcriptional regulator
MSARQIATELGIAETTVITHRNSAYARAGVTNLRVAARKGLPIDRDLLRRLATLHGRRVIQ